MPAMRLGTQEDKEMEMLLNEIHHATSPHPHHHHDDARAGNDQAHRMQYMHPVRDKRGSSVNDGPLPSHALLLDGHGRGYGHGAGRACMSPPPLVSEGSSSSSLSGTVSPAGEDWMMEELGLLGGLRAMSIGNDREAALGPPPKSALVPALPNNGMSPSLGRTGYGNNLVLGSALDDTYGAPRRAVLPNSPLFDVDERLYGSGLRDHCFVDADLLESWLEAHRLDSPASYSDGLCTAPENREKAIGAAGAFGANSYYRGGRGSGFPSSFLRSTQNGVALGRDLNASNSPSPLHLVLSKQGCSLPYGWMPQSPFLARNLRTMEALGCEGPFIQGKGLHYVGNQRGGLLEERKRSQLDDRMYLRGIPAANVDSVLNVCSPEFSHNLSLPFNYDYLIGIEGYIYHIAKDQHGCRFLQRKFDEGRHQVDVIFNGIIDHVAELMVDPFGNYLMQKLLDACNEEQMSRIVLMLTKDAEDLVKISLNIHGTRAVQKLIETLKNRQQIVLVISALQPGFLDLMKDLNGNHVVQRCLQSFSAEDNKFIFDAVLQRCISHSTGEHRMKLVAEISVNGLKLAQDDFGNYVVQYILDLKSPLVAANLASQFEGNYVQLSMQKFSSHVVEKCIKVFGEDDLATIISELLSMSQFEQLLQHPYANYVIQSALQNTKGSLHTSLVEAIRPHTVILRANPYCKRIFSRALPKK